MNKFIIFDPTSDDPYPVYGHGTRLKMPVDPRKVEKWGKQWAARPGAKCGNCEKPFNAVRKYWGTIVIENGIPGCEYGDQLHSMYPVCRACGIRSVKEGLGGVPHAYADALETLKGIAQRAQALADAVPVGGTQ